MLHGGRNSRNKGQGAGGKVKQSTDSMDTENDEEWQSTQVIDDQLNRKTPICLHPPWKPNQECSSSIEPFHSFSSLEIQTLEPIWCCILCKDLRQGPNILPHLQSSTRSRRLCKLCLHLVLEVPARFDVEV